MALLESDVRTRRWRRAEYDQLVELGMFHGERLELLDGLLVVGEPQGSLHMAAVMHIGKVLEAAFGPGFHARLHGPLALDYRSQHPSTAPLVVEVADSSLRLDRRFKVGLYARARLPEYWIVNLVDGAVEVYRDPQPEPDAEYGAIYRSVTLVQPPAAITPLGAPTARVLAADLLPPAS